MKHKSFLFLILVLTNNFYSQNRGMDSLKNIIRITTSDTTKVNAQIAVCRMLWTGGELDSAMVYAEEAFNLSKRIDYKKGMANAYNNKGVVYMFKGDYSKAEELYLLANKMFQLIDFKKKIADTYNNLGEVNRHMGNYPKALQFHYLAMKMREALKDSIGVAMSYNNIGVIQEKQLNIEEALKSYFNCLKIYEVKGSKSDIARTYNNIAEVYRLQRKFQKALEYQAISLKLRTEINESTGIAMSRNNIGSITYEMAKAAIKSGDRINGEKLYEESLNNFISSHEMMKNAGDMYFLTVTGMNIGNILTFQKKYKEAEVYLIQALESSKKMRHKECLKLIYGDLADLNVGIGNFKEAYKNYQLSIVYRDSLINEENTKKIVETRMNYEFDKKNAIAKAEQKQKDILTEKEKQEQRWILYTVIMGLVLVLVFSGFLFNRFKVTNRQKKIIERKEKEAQKQNEIISIQKNIVEEKHKEITDSINYAERIQRALLASEKILNENLEEYFVLFKPKDVVSGDFYWASKLKNNNFILLTADSTGHGVPGAIMSILNISCIDKAVTMGLVGADRILNETRKLVIESLRNDGSEEGGKDGMDGSLISFDFKNNKMECACSNAPVWIVRKNELMEIKPDRMPIGKHERDIVPFTLHNVNLEKGDLIYTLTDGFADQFGGQNGKKFKYKQLQALILSISNDPMQTQKQKLNEAFNVWKGDLEQVDDVCLIGIRV